MTLIKIVLKKKLKIINHKNYILNSSYTLYRIMFIDNNLKIIIVREQSRFKRGFEQIRNSSRNFYCLALFIPHQSHWLQSTLKCCCKRRVWRLFNYLIAILGHYSFIVCFKILFVNMNLVPLFTFSFWWCNIETEKWNKNNHDNWVTVIWIAFDK